MKYTIRFTYFTILTILFLSCESTKYLDITDTDLVDKKATESTKLLYKEILTISEEGIAIGHQDATAYGLGWKASLKDFYRNDIHDVVGKYPAVQGWDLGHIELGNDVNLDSVSFNLMRTQIIRTYLKGGITTISWHLDNPATDESSWDKTPAVASILPDGVNRDKYLLWVDKLAQFFASVKTIDGQYIPMIFRPFHEMNGGWFWWGAGNCSVEEYHALFRDLVSLLKEKGVHHLLYAYAPNSLNSPDEYAKFYPGDEYVDILGIDIYNHGGDAGFAEKLQLDIKVMRDFASAHNKPYALTETGNVKPENTKWFTEVLYPGVKDTGIAWILFWRNSTEEHYFATYPGEVADKDFKSFTQKEDILLMEDIGKYKVKN